MTIQGNYQSSEGLKLSQVWHTVLDLKWHQISCKEPCQRKQIGVKFFAIINFLLRFTQLLYHSMNEAALKKRSLVPHRRMLLIFVNNHDACMTWHSLVYQKSFNSHVLKKRLTAERWEFEKNLLKWKYMSDVSC